MIRAVIDTSVLVRGFMSQRQAEGRILVAVARGTFEPVVSKASLVELRRVVARPDRGHHTLDRSVAEVVIGRLEEQPLVVIETTQLPLHSRDAKDAYLVITALVGKATYIVTVDNDLLVLADDLHPERVEVVVPARFVEILEAEGVSPPRR